MLERAGIAYQACYSIAGDWQTWFLLIDAPEARIEIETDGVRCAHPIPNGIFAEVPLSIPDFDKALLEALRDLNDD
jgi:hypothetical protein